MVSGFSGVGKTALVKELHKMITQEKGHFIEGKFDQFQRNIPYSAVIQAFKDMCRQILRKSAQELEEWQTKITEALGANAQLIIEIIPEIYNTRLRREKYFPRSCSPTREPIQENHAM